MTAGQVAESELPYLELNDSIDKAMGFMDEFKLTHFPVIDGSQFVGLIYEEDIYEIDDWSQSISNSKIRLPNVCIDATKHFLSCVNKMQVSKISCLPVVDAKSTFLGVVSRSRIVDVFGKAAIVEDAGGVIEVEMAITDYYLTEISRIVENTGVKILGTYIRTSKDNNKLVLTIKLNKQEVESVINSLDRFGYQVVASYQAKSENDDMQNRYDNLMNYLNI
ncbi:MAG: CBS domain-containing protein [Salibacteraceae bacterium]